MKGGDYKSFGEKWKTWLFWYPTQGKTLTFGIDGKTKITRAKKELNMTHLKNGKNVLVEYKKEGDKLIAAAIKVSAPK